MKLILGDEFGLLKEVKTTETTVSDSYGEIKPNKEIISIIKSSSDFSIDPILFITEPKETYAFNWKTKAIIDAHTLTDKSSFTSSIHKTIQGNHVVIASKTNNSLSILTYGDDYHIKHIDTIDNLIYNRQSRLVRVETSSYRTRKEKEKGVVENIICLYEDAPLALYDITTKQFSWKAKNLPNDELGLRIPMYDTNACQSDNKPSVVYVSTAYGDIRTYDIKAKNIPAVSVNVSQNKIHKMILVNDNYVVIGDTKGYAALFDARKNMNLVKSFKGNTSSIKDIAHMPNSSLIAICGYDRYLRWYDFKKGMNGHVYMKNKCTQICFIQKLNDKEDEEEDDDEEEEENELYSDLEEEENVQEGEDNEYEEDEESKEQISNNKKTKRHINDSKEENEYNDNGNSESEEYPIKTKNTKGLNKPNKKQKNSIN